MTPTRFSLRSVHRQSGDEGVAMVSVMGLVLVLTTIMIVATVTAVSAIQSSRDHVSFEQSLAAAEAGVDANLANVAKAFSEGNPGWTNPSPCALPAPTASDVSSEANERAWARTQLGALPSSCLVTTPQGQFVAGRAPGRQAIYAIGYSPSRTSPDVKSRVLKAEYVFGPYAPGKALLTGGNLDFSGSVAISHLDPSLPADVHTNSNVVGMNNSLQIGGALTATGTLSGSCPSNVAAGCAGSKPEEPMPIINPRTVWSTYAPYDPNWVDLCPLGVAKKPNPTDTVPCAGTVVSSGPWVYSTVGGVPTWTYPRTSSNVPGAYYVYGGNAQVGDNGNAKDLRKITVIAEALPVGGPATQCGKFGGNIEWKLFNLEPYLTGLVFLAGSNLTGGANADAGPGMFLAVDKVDLQTSSSVMTGAIIATNGCAAAGVNNIQGVTIRYDQTIEAPVNDLIRTTLWLEYGG